MFVLLQTRISSWLVVYEKGDERLVNKMVEVLVADAPTIGIEMLQPRKRAVVGDTAEAYEALLSSYLRANVSHTTSRHRSRVTMLLRREKQVIH